MRKPRLFVLNNQSYNAMEAKKICQRILHANVIGSLLTGDDLKILKDVVLLRTGVNTEQIKVDSDNTIYKTKCFWYKTFDWQSISYKNAFNTKEVATARRNTSAFRLEIAAQIVDFKRQSDVKDKFDKVVDHIIPFAYLLRQFLALKKVNLIDIKTRTSGNLYILEDRNLAREWWLFHKKNAQLAVVSNDENQAKVKEDKAFLKAHLPLLNSGK